MSKTITFTDEELVEIGYAVNMAHDMSNDGLLENLPFYPNNVREMAKKSDEDIRAEITEMRNDLDEKVNALLALKSIRQKLIS